MNALSPEYIQKLRIEVECLHGLLASLERERAAVPKLGWMIVLMLPAGYFWGLWGVLGVLFATIVFMVTAVYIIGVRRNEYTWTLRTVEAQLKAHDADAGHAA